VVIPSVGSIVIVPFPFSDLSSSKLRPAVVLAPAGRQDWILCQMTSRPYGDADALVIMPADLALGSLRMQSYARPAKLFTANLDIIMDLIGELTSVRRDALLDAVIGLFRGGRS
jgi:mRNA interferase MazF